MSSRHALVIGSQCDALPNQRLSFLPDRARELFEVLIDPLRGGCEAAPTSVFLTDPTMEELRQAVSTAVAQASAAGATLVLAFIGHAVTAPSRYSQPLFLLPADGNPNTPGTETAYEIGHRLGEMCHPSPPRSAPGSGISAATRLVWDRPCCASFARSGAKLPVGLRRAHPD